MVVVGEGGREVTRIGHPEIMVHTYIMCLHVPNNTESFMYSPEPNPNDHADSHK